MEEQFYSLTRDWSREQWLLASTVAAALLAMAIKAVLDLIFIFRNHRSW